MRKKIAVPLGVAAVGLAGLGYAAGVEVNFYRLRRFELPVLEPGSDPIRILQVSDIHMVPGQRRKQKWLRSLAELEPDLVVNTGDNLSHPDAVGPVLDALEPLLRVPGVFVFGSNDYYQATKLNPAKYLRRGDLSHAPRKKREQNDWQLLEAGLAKHGWLQLNNARGALELGGRRFAFVGLDDPHVKRDRYELVAGGPDIDAEITLGVTHAPYLRALDAFAADGIPVILAGHTHGGQLCIPGYGALVTNCDLDTDRVKGLNTHTAPNERTSYLHVSAGCGTSRFAPVRFACPPEASLLTLVPRH
ncbi:metallophosphoesterase [Actinospica robiniae]|uniref:metallophosphoesterase n=1 Tax=Actinospica robiniae TaxID=304901 RepID=UPI0004141920|nr:metallophosphoesterase [Actinospica robiniae]